mmetsp:Transcript_66492/g.177071  ORF Transcript_66492/g.177071 Transcript_66492/m.177071 type:complete len:215 (-) Transcript_66492:133-777(-)
MGSRVKTSGLSKLSSGVRPRVVRGSATAELAKTCIFTMVAETTDRRSTTVLSAILAASNWARSCANGPCMPCRRPRRAFSLSVTSCRRALAFPVATPASARDSSAAVSVCSSSFRFSSRSVSSHWASSRAISASWKIPKRSFMAPFSSPRCSRSALRPTHALLHSATSDLAFASARVFSSCCFRSSSKFPLVSPAPASESLCAVSLNLWHSWAQ